VIENCFVKGRNVETLIGLTLVKNAIVRNCKGTSLDPTILNKPRPLFVQATWAQNIIIENNEMENTRGMSFIDKNKSAAGYAGGDYRSLRVRFNKAKNLNGLRSDGEGDLNAIRGTASFVAMLSLQEAAVEVSWNESVMEPFQGAGEDLITSYGSKGTAANPILIHNNFIDGNYSKDPVRDNPTGTAIMLGDLNTATLQPQHNPATSPGYVWAYDNQLIRVHSGIAISSGNNNKVFRNRVVISAILPDGRDMRDLHGGTIIWDYYGWEVEQPTRPPSTTTSFTTIWCSCGVPTGDPAIRYFALRRRLIVSARHLPAPTTALRTPGGTTVLSTTALLSLPCPSVLPGPMKTPNTLFGERSNARRGSESE